MRTFRIHYNVNGSTDYIDISGETIEEIRIKVGKELAKRDVDPNDSWSEEI